MNKRVLIKILKALGVILVLIGIIIFTMFTFKFVKDGTKNHHRMLKVRESITIELGSPLPSAKNYFTDFFDYDEKEFVIEYSKDIPLNEEKLTTEQNEVHVKIKHDGKEYESKIKINDTVGPVLVLKDVSLKVGSTVAVEQFITSCFDLSGDCTYEIISYVPTLVGVHEIKIRATDKNGNRTTESTKLTLAENVVVPTCDKNKKADESEYVTAVDIPCDAINAGAHSIYGTKANTIMNNEIKTASENSNWGNAGVAYVYGAYVEIHNNAGQVIGYAVGVVLTDINENLLAAYYLDINGNRIWDEKTIDIN